MTYTCPTCGSAKRKVRRNIPQNRNSLRKRVTVRKCDDLWHDLPTAEQIGTPTLLPDQTDAPDCGNCEHRSVQTNCCDQPTPLPDEVGMAFLTIKGHVDGEVQDCPDCVDALATIRAALTDERTRRQAAEADLTRSIGNTAHWQARAEAAERVCYGLLNANDYRREHGRRPVCESLLADWLRKRETP